MVHVNVPKVRGKMAEKNMTLTSLAHELWVGRGTLSHYLEEPGKMPYGVVSNMARLLCDGADEATAIFFGTDLR